MSKTYANILSPGKTPQREQADPLQVENNAGGYSFVLDDWQRLDRFLILGSEGGTYYTNERKLTKDNAQAVLRCIEKDGPRVVRRAVEISREGRAPKNDPAIFVLALAVTYGDQATKEEVLHPDKGGLLAVCRIGTHLFAFVSMLHEMRGWSRLVMRGVRAWYDRDQDKLATQLLKYQQRNGWGHRDVIRLSHARHPATGIKRELLDYAEKGWDGIGPLRPDEDAVAKLWAFEKAKRLPANEKGSIKELQALIAEYRLEREMIPTWALNHADVWEYLLPNLGLTAVIRNLPKLSSVGLLTPFSDQVAYVTRRLMDSNDLAKARVHPVALLMALFGYKEGSNRNLTWTPVPQVTDALEQGFNLAFKHVEPTGKRWLLGIDVSGSMQSGVVAGVPGLTPRLASAAMAMVTARTEPSYYTMAFDTGLRSIGITAKMSLIEVKRKLDINNGGGTDCALPIVKALENKWPVDVFVIYTDNETWFGPIHPHEALKVYRDKTGIDAKLIVVGFTATEFTIAKPNDPGMLDVVGFDAAAPALMADFARGSV